MSELESGFCKKGRGEDCPECGAMQEVPVVQLRGAKKISIRTRDELRSRQVRCRAEAVDFLRSIGK